MDSIKTQLLDMGFNELKVKRAIESCPEAQSLEQIMEWLIAHEEELNGSLAPTWEELEDRGQQPVAGSSSSKQKPLNPEEAKTTQTQMKTAAKAKAPSAKNPTTKSPGGEADVATKDDKGEETAKAMAARKKITVEDAQKLINERQKLRAEEERKRAIDDEKKRRIDGQKMAETRQELQDQDRIRLAQQIRREKIEKEEHRKRVLEQIARDREAMKARADGSSVAAAPTAATNKSPTTINSNTNKAPAPKECRVALRFPDGSNIIQKFAPHESLAAVRLFVQNTKNVHAPVSFVAPPNKKLTDSMMNDTLEDLGLCPASRLEVNFLSASDASWSDVDCLD